VAELVDAQDSGSCGGFLVGVRVTSSAPDNQGFTVITVNPFSIRL
jgi:hypothetical protein